MRHLENQTGPVGRVLGTDDATPFDFWVALNPNDYLQLDDVVALRRQLPRASSPP